MITADRELEDKSGIFAQRIKNLHPDAVIDNICFTQESAEHLSQALLGNIQHLIVTGTIWVHGYSETIPTLESAKRRPFGTYGINKNKIEEYLLESFHRHKLPVTILHPGHIVGMGWPCLNPQGNFNLEVFQIILEGKPLVLPNLGLESVHHVHADDLAQSYQKAIENPSQSIGESFHVVSPQALTLRFYAESAYRWFGHQPNLEFVPLSNLSNRINPDDFHQITEHVLRSPCMSIEKARSKLDYRPRYSSLEACHESVQWMIDNHRLIIPKNAHS